ncbi:TetR/AcrR family transcriptional regulator [Hansschlegelia zhihuaiae]|uniref:TetR/AcrR family transcriptional regulator n=1 Tax=Hansschlegelia zhihuaiae TaxID=405005 RepID=A0A4Q0MI40_9HYPH|nr:TetR/AcrR family transcriptional regulator [Hansschlegelia zhihuaiae]RXF73124.1 TetR/AcrR family transcriptional regulator [Hansschlegelia zhihuaiae]
MQTTMDEPKAVKVGEAPRDDALDSAKRRQILDGAREVFLAHGFDAASMGEIARAAGVSKGTLYVYFESKEELFGALVKRQCALTAERLFELDADSHDVREVLTRLGQSFIAAMVEPSHVSTVRMVIGCAERKPEIGQLFLDAGPRAGVRRVSTWLRAKIEQGELEIEDAELAAWQFLTTCNSAVMMPVLVGGERPPSRERIAYLVDRAVDMFLAAYGPKGAGDQR